MGVGKDHLKLVSNGDSLDHVADSGSDGSQDGVSFLLLQPHAELEGRGLALLTGLLTDLDRDVFEATGESTQLALDYHFTGLDLDVDALGDL